MRCPTSGKVQYDSRKDAKNGRRKRPELRKGSNVSGTVRPYLCSDCGCWHLGHLPSKALRHGRQTLDDAA